MGAPLSYSDAKRAAHQAATAALSGGAGMAVAAQAAITAAEHFFHTVRTTLNLDAVLARTACKAGCNWCCHQIVGVTAGELALVAEAIAELPSDRQQQIGRRARAAMLKGRGLDQAGWWMARIACPLLEPDGLCAIHACRPMACRAYNSANAELCRRSFAGEPVRAPVLAAQHGVWSHAQSGLAEALSLAGIASGPVALAEGVEGLFTFPAGL